MKKKSQMMVIAFSDYYSEFIRQSDDICLVARQIDELRNRILQGKNFNDISEVVIKNIQNLLFKWTGNTYIGEKKPDKFQRAFQSFFCSLYKLLIAMRETANKQMNEIANKALYQGRVYRYLGHSEKDEQIGRISPDYNGVYVSWSKKERVAYIKSKLYGPKTYMTCDISKDFFGIDLAAFGIENETEAEVVFPTLRECIVDIQYIY